MSDLYDVLQPGDAIIVKAYAHGKRLGVVQKRRRDGRILAWKAHLDLNAWSGPMDLHRGDLLGRATSAQANIEFALRGDPRGAA